MFPLFLKRKPDVLAPRLAAVCWRVANVTSIPIGPLPPQWPITDQFP